MLLFLTLPLTLLVLPIHQEPVQGIPDAASFLDEIYAGYGPAEKRSAHENLRTRGSVSWVGLPSKGTLQETYAALGEVRLAMAFEGFGDFETGIHDGLVWEKDSTGIRIKRGWDGTELIRRVGLFQQTDWRKLYSGGRIVGKENVEGQACWKLELEPRYLMPGDPPAESAEGEAVEASAERPSVDTWYVTQASMRPLRILTRTPGTDGNLVTVRQDWSEWAPVDGILYPHKIQMEISGFTMEVAYESFEHNVELEENFFAPAEDILAASKADPIAAKSDDEAPRIETLTERHIASIRVTCKHADMQKTLTVLLPEAFQYVTSVGATMTGPPLVRYHSFGDTVDLEAAMPLAEPVEGKGRVKPGKLVAGKGIVAWHIGPYDKLGETHERIEAFAKANGLERDGAFWEEYWTDPGMEPDPSKWRTKIVWPVVEIEQK